MNALAAIYDDSSDNGVIRTEWLRTAMNTTKLFFDHALDQAMDLGYVTCHGSKETIWIKAEGRAKLVMVISNQKQSKGSVLT